MDNFDETSRAGFFFHLTTDDFSDDSFGSFEESSVGGLKISDGLFKVSWLRLIINITVDVIIQSYEMFTSDKYWGEFLPVVCSIHTGKIHTVKTTHSLMLLQSECHSDVNGAQKVVLR